MKKYILYGSFGLLVACQLPAEKRAKKIEQRISDNTQILAVDSNLAADTSLSVVSLPIEQKVKNPKGIYQVSLPMEGGIQHTVAFYPNNTYQLQEKYKNDSIVITIGNWAPSNGYIWLYRDQVVRARYNWSGSQLQYFSPAMKKNWIMKHLQDALQSRNWQNKRNDGVIVFAVGNEPSWQAEVNNKDSISFQLSEWPTAFKLKVNASETNRDSTVFTAQNDSMSVRLVVLPYFCNDGMSDMIYKNKVRMQYNNKMYSGCGVLFQ